MRYENLTGDKKALKKRMEELAGEKADFTRAPRFAYVLKGVAIERDGAVTIEEDADEGFVRMLADEGAIRPMDEESSESAGTEDADSVEAHEGETERIKPSISFPLARHRAESVCNLVYTIYSKGKLISKATGGSFYAADELVEALRGGSHRTVEEVLETIRDEGGDKLTGIRFEEGKVVFDGFPDTDDPMNVKAWTSLSAAINSTAIKQYHVRAKRTDEPNEKFAFRTWLTRLGMKGSDMKEERNILYRHLSGHTAFRTPADQEKWTKRQNEKRDALRALKEAAEEEAANFAEESAE